MGPTGPRLAASELHSTIWGAAPNLWDDGHLRAAVQTAATAPEGLLQSTAGPSLSGENLAVLYSVSEPVQGSPRLRIGGVDPASKTWKSAHEGAAALVRGAFLAVRNLVSHPGWPEPDIGEALEMIAVLSHVAHLVGRSDTISAPLGRHVAARRRMRSVYFLACSNTRISRRSSTTSATSSSWPS
ncbi:TIGR02391 family protein [Mycobacterium sp. ML3]